MSPTHNYHMRLLWLQLSTYDLHDRTSGGEYKYDICVNNKSTTITVHDRNSIRKCYIGN